MLQVNKLSRIPAFTLLESLLVLFLVSSMLLVLSSKVSLIYKKVHQELFFIEFEHLYKETQQLSQANGQESQLLFTKTSISNGYQTLILPDHVIGPDHLLTFDSQGGNHSLSKISFQTPEGQVHYQVYLGSGQYQKTSD